MASMLYFGTDAIDAIGIVQKIDDDSSVEVAEAPDEEGKVIEERAYSKNKEYQIEALVKNGITPPDAGDTVTIDEVAYLVRSRKISKGNTEYRKVSITASKKDAAELVTYE